MEVGIKNLFAVMFALFITVLYCALVVASDADDRMDEIMASKLIVPEVTPVPAPEEAPAEKDNTAWMRFNCPLSDDLQKYICEKCREYKVDPALVIAVIDVETNGTFDPESKGDYENGIPHSFGLMQIWASEHTPRCLRLNAYNLLDPRQNILVGIDFLSELIDHYDGDMDEVLSFYNCDSTGNYARLVKAKAEQYDESKRIVEG